MKGKIIHTEISWDTKHGNAISILPIHVQKVCKQLFTGYYTGKVLCTQNSSEVEITYSDNWNQAPTLEMWTKMWKTKPILESLSWKWYVQELCLIKIPMSLHLQQSDKQKEKNSGPPPSECYTEWRSVAQKFQEKL